MTFAWFWVCFAVVAEIGAALALRHSDGFTRPLPTAIALVSFASAFYLVSLALLQLPVSIVYPIWAGGGTAGVALLSMILMKEQKGIWKVSGIVLVVLGIVLLNFVPGGHDI